MSDSFDVDAYLDRIHYGGDVRPTLETLSALLLAHSERIPFENFDVLLGRPIRLDLDSLQKKIVRDRRGGYCFESVTLFAAALEHLGFRPTAHTARVTLFNPRSEAGRTHMFLTVPLAEGTFMLDPGFGGPAPRFPVPVPADDDSGRQDGDATHVLVRDGRFFVLRARTADGMIDAWSSTLEPENAVDFEMGSHFTATYQASPFVNRLMLRAFCGDTIVSAMNQDVTLRRHDETESLRLADRSALRALVGEHFGFDLPEIERLRVPSIPEWQ
jgi:N-hydroxyarylamine O-acetyltransferase